MNFFLHSGSPSETFHSKNFQKTLILVFEASSAFSCQNGLFPRFSSLCCATTHIPHIFCHTIFPFLELISKFLIMYFPCSSMLLKTALGIEFMLLSLSATIHKAKIRFTTLIDTSIDDVQLMPYGHGLLSFHLTHCNPI